MPLPSTYLYLSFNGENLVTFNAQKGIQDIVQQLEGCDSSFQKDAIYGYALGNHDELVQQLILINPDLVADAVQEYARAGEIEKVQELTKKYPETRESAVYGYAQGGYDHQVKSALKSSFAQYSLPVIKGYASTNHMGLIGLLEGTLYYPQAVETAAQNGQYILVQQLFNILKINDTHPFILDIEKPESCDQFKVLNAALGGFMRGSHFNKAGQLINIGANATHAILVLTNRQRRVEKEDIIIFLSHINNPSLRSDTLLKALEIIPHLKHDEFDLDRLEQINKYIQEGKDYLDIKAMLNLEESEHDPLEEHLREALIHHNFTSNTERPIEVVMRL